ncbi:glycerate kinase [Conexibacter sp. JD483]|uniref:glycerate kinase n=1 Tax=unclassified Conexibacter TaxID=2627773 RepID=UPI002727EA37|nr:MULTISPECIES: glycerate kinase [unclassified Conexibacter]MDO8183995.1 glycerate kinase [Conexibacter sp. CPCC 205706]MDO8196987.1 glycerate kinase [Conexibacter sp. CPCC 205762]MDR9369043.1 glycerate kinase [Conexibacter sp. JD483]
MAAPVLVAPAPFRSAGLRATQVAAALGRGLEAGGWEVDLCPLADGGAGTLEVLLPALAGETAAVEVGGRRVGIGLIEDGGTAIVELGSVLPGDGEGGSSAPAGELLLAAAQSGAEVLLVGAGDVRCDDGGEGMIEAIASGGGIAPRLVVLCDVRTPARGIGWGAAGDGIAAALAEACDAKLESGASFVLDVLDGDARMRAAHAVIVGEGLLDLRTLAGKAPGELATRARQSGVPCFAVVGGRTLDPFGGRILDLQAVLEAPTLAAIEAAGGELARLV